MVVDGEGWHRGVIGICASRVAERFGRPALVISRDGDEAHGSGAPFPAFICWMRWRPRRSSFCASADMPRPWALPCRAEHVAELRRRLNEYARAKPQR